MKGDQVLMKSPQGTEFTFDGAFADGIVSESFFYPCEDMLSLGVFDGFNALLIKKFRPAEAYHFAGLKREGTVIPYFLQVFYKRIYQFDCSIHNFFSLGMVV